MISDEDAERAMDWLVSNADKMAQARANRVQLEEGRKSLKAILMKEHGELSVNAQEREAYASKRYQQYIEGLGEAVKQDEKFRFLKEAAHERLNIWRTHCANVRGIK